MLLQEDNKDPRVSLDLLDHLVLLEAQVNLDHEENLEAVVNVESLALQVRGANLDLQDLLVNLVVLDLLDHQDLVVKLESLDLQERLDLLVCLILYEI